MSWLDYGFHTAQAGNQTDAELSGRDGKLHRIAEVRRSQGVSRSAVARRLNTDVGVVESQEDPTTDLPLSALYQWQSVLEVPVSELLVETDEPLSAPVMKRARLLRLMKTAAAIHKRANQPTIQRMAQALMDQLVEIMPELANISHGNDDRPPAESEQAGPIHPVLGLERDPNDE